MFKKVYNIDKKRRSLECILLPKFNISEHHSIHIYYPISLSFTLRHIISFLLHYKYIHIFTKIYFLKKIPLDSQYMYQHLI